MHKKIAILLLSLIPAGLFLVSAIAKLWDIDSFQDYLFATGLLRLDHAIVLARLLIAFELIVALLFIFRWQARAVSLTSFCVLLLFDFFLLHQYLEGSSSDCHCFGNLVALSPGWSLLKNLFLQLLIAGYGYMHPVSIRPTHLHRWLIALVAASFVLAFSVRLPLNRWKHSLTPQSYCENCVRRFIRTQALEKERIVLCFFSTECRYCRLAAGRMSTIALKTHHADRIRYVVWNETGDTRRLFDPHNSGSFPAVDMKEDAFLELTQGQMPLILLADKGKIIRSYRYSDIDDDAILSFIENK